MAQSLSKRCLTDKQWNEFADASDTGSAVRIVTDALQFASPDPNLNRFLRKFKSCFKVSVPDVLQKVVLLQHTSTKSDLDCVIRKVTRLIAAQSAAENPVPAEMALLYRMRSHLHLLKHEKLIKESTKHGKSAFMSALVDLEVASNCQSQMSDHSVDSNTGIPDLEQLRKWLVSLKNVCLAKKCKSECQMLPVGLKRLQHQSHSRSGGGDKVHNNPNGVDEGYRSLSPRSKSDSSTNYRVCESATKGRFLRAARKFESGDVVLSESAFVSSLSSDFLSFRCNHCHYRITDSYIKCDRNCPVVFCSLPCYKTAAVIHEKECPVMAVIVNENTHFQLVLRFFIRCYETLFLPHVTDDRVRKAELLAHHFNRYSPSYRFDVTVKSLNAAFLLSKMGVLDIKSDLSNRCLLMSRVLTYLCQIETNSVALTDKIGSAIFIEYSMACHSCSPNVDYNYQRKQQKSRLFRETGPILWLVANQVIEAGTELTISYASGRTLSERRRLLQSSYFFRCNCDLCLDEARELNDLNEHKPNTKCSSCGQDLVKSDAPDESPDPEHLFSCRNSSCSQFEITINFQKELQFIRDFLQHRILIMKDSEKFTEQMRTSCLKQYDRIVKLFMSPNLLQLDFAIFMSKCFSHCGNRHGAQDPDGADFRKWAKTAFEISDYLLGFHSITAECFHRMASVSHPALPLTSKQTMQCLQSQFHELRLQVTQEQIQFFDEEVPFEKRKCLTKF